jgi:hypothetical protein
MGFALAVVADAVILPANMFSEHQIFDDNEI